MKRRPQAPRTPSENLPAKALSRGERLVRSGQSAHNSSPEEGNQNSGERPRIRWHACSSRGHSRGSSSVAEDSARRESKAQSAESRRCVWPRPCVVMSIQSLSIDFFFAANPRFDPGDTPYFAPFSSPPPSQMCAEHGTPRTWARPPHHPPLC